MRNERAASKQATESRGETEKEKKVFPEEGARILPFQQEEREHFAACGPRREKMRW
jgi:hypothetical protein